MDRIKNMEPLVYSAAEVAKVLKTDNNTILAQLQSGEIPAYKEGRYWKVPKTALQKYIEEKAIREAEIRRERYANKS